jgi:hypothetical protein
MGNRPKVNSGQSMGLVSEKDTCSGQPGVPAISCTADGSGPAVSSGSSVGGPVTESCGSDQLPQVH